MRDCAQAAALAVHLYQDEQRCYHLSYGPTGATGAICGMESFERSEILARLRYLRVRPEMFQKSGRHLYAIPD